MAWLPKGQDLDVIVLKIIFQQMFFPTKKVQSFGKMILLPLAFNKFIIAYFCKDFYKA